MQTKSGKELEKLIRTHPPEEIRLAKSGIVLSDSLIQHKFSLVISLILHCFFIQQEDEDGWQNKNSIKIKQRYLIYW